MKVRVKVRVKVANYGYMGLMKGSVHDAFVYTNSFGNVEYHFKHMGREWALTQDDCEELVSLDDFPSPNEKLLDVISTDLKQDSVLDIQHGGSHYKDKKIQPIEYITANNLDFCQGNIVKYVTRHKDKNGAEDIRKVIHYAQFILKFEYGEED